MAKQQFTGAAGENHAAFNPLQEAVESKESGVNTPIEDVEVQEETEEQLERQRKIAPSTVRVSEVTETGWFDVDMSTLGFDGKLYPLDMQILYRAARSAEIRHWSNLDDKASLIVAANQITDMVSACCKVVSKSGENVYTYKDIYEHDKWKLLFLIHEITFPDDTDLTNPIKLTITSATCKHKFSLSMGPDNIHWKVVESTDDFPNGIHDFDKYIDPLNGMWSIGTKNLGVLNIKPQTIGVAEAFMSYMSTLQDAAALDAAQKTLLSAQWFALDWRHLNNKAVEKLCQKFNSYDAITELPFILDLLDVLNISAAETFKFVCPQCKEEGTAPFRFPNGIKQMFRRISNIKSQLL